MVSKPFQTLKKQTDFLNLKSQGQRFWASHWLLISFQSNSNLGFREGLTLSRKVGNSVLRNKLKRWKKEKTREHLKNAEAQNIDVNFIFKPLGQEFYGNLSYQEFSKIFEKAFRQMRTHA